MGLHYSGDEAIVDASIIEPSSTKNRAGERDPEMHPHLGDRLGAQREHDGGQPHDVTETHHLLHDDGVVRAAQAGGKPGASSGGDAGNWRLER